MDAIKQGMKDAGREFEDDHFGTGINFRFGKWDDDVVVRAAERFERDAGLPKLILRPLASDDADTMRQTQLMIEEVQPAIRVMSREMNMD